jgi:hypothetical protein
VSQYRISPLNVSPRRFYFSINSPPGDPISEQILPPENVFQYKVSGGEDISSPVKIKSPTGEIIFRNISIFIKYLFIKVKCAKIKKGNLLIIVNYIV